MTSDFTLEDQERVARHADILRLVAAACGTVVFAFVSLTFTSAATAWICIGIAAVALVGLIAVVSRLRQIRATPHAIQSELPPHD